MFQILTPEDMAFFSQLADHLAWPVVVLILACKFRRPLTLLAAALARRAKSLSKLKLPGVEAEFTTALLMAEVNANTAHLSAPSTHQLQAILELAASSKVEAILRAWNEVEAAIGSALRREARAGGFVPMDETMQWMRSRELGRETINLYLELLSIRNQIVHVGANRVSFDEALRFSVLALRLADTIRAKTQ